MLRKRLVAGNWKMNLTPSEAKKFVSELKGALINKDAEVLVCVPDIDITAVSEAVLGSDIKVGAQNMYFEEKGAFTGETSPLMLKDAGVCYVVIGHSERRAYFHETDEIVNKKVLKAVEQGIVPIVCVGETLDQREQGITVDLVRLQTKIALKGLTEKQVAEIVVAYEPVWAIGTGKTATSEQAEEVCAAIRNVIGEVYGKETAEKTRILYGGSVNGKNAAELFAMENIDGGLVGGASLKLEFADIVNC
ncbi:MAG: triose-phosphate isomerase [Lachnospiraceae bacterium]|nr:triose-phosphate isomerase [Lachnospiraceae bacterium]